MADKNDYKGYSSISLGDNYDDVTEKKKDIASSCGGVVDARSDLKGVRAKFYNKDSRDEFNKKIEKLNRKEESKNKETSGLTTNESIKSLLKVIKEEVNNIKLNQNKMKTYKVGDLKRLVRESAENEFEPKMGDNVQKDNKKNNEKAYKDMESATKKYDGGMTKEKNFKLPEDDNRGMESLRVNNPNKAYSDRIKSQLKGFVSAEAEKIHGNEKLGNAEYGSDEVVNQFKKKGEKFADGKAKATEIGLTGRELNKKEVKDQYKSLYSENKIVKLTFKNTEFLSENHMLSKVPDLYMVEGKKFKMCDKNSNEYIVEWHADKPIVKRHFSQNNILAEQAKMKHLFSYKSGEVNSTPCSRLQENKEISDMLGKVRKLMK